MIAGTFQAIAPGIMVFAVLLLIAYTATSLAKEKEQRTIQRFRLARVGPWGLLAGVFAAQMAIASFAFVLMFVTADYMGFDNQGSYLDAYAVILATAAGAIGIGMGVAAFVRRRDEAGSLSMLLAIPLAFLSGAFFKVPGVTIWRSGDRSLDLYDLLPTTHAIEALQGILNEGSSLSGVSESMVALSAISGGLLVLGSLLYWARRMRAPRGTRSATLDGAEPETPGLDGA